MRHSRLPLAVLSAALLVGCKEPGPTDSVKALDDAFAKRSSEVSDEDARRNKELADLALAASKSNDLVTVGASLQSLRTTKSMSLDQRMAVQDAMVNFQSSLAVRAERGDPAAKEALDSLRGKHFR